MRERKKRKRTCVFQKAGPLKKHNPSLFLVTSLLEPLMRSNLDAYFLGKIVTSQAVLDHLNSCKETIAEIILAIKKLIVQRFGNINCLILLCQNFLLSQFLCCGQVPKFLVFIK